MADTGLRVELETPLPASLPAGGGAALFCFGSAFHTQAPLAELTLLVDGTPYRPAASGMPRPRLQPGARTGGFWATLPVRAPERPGAIELRARARLADGSVAEAELGRIEIVAPERPAGQQSPGLIAICMATFDPDPELFRTQVASLREQTDQRWTCLISDDCSSPERFEQLQDVVGDDPRFVISRSERRLGFYRNFERALGLVPAEAELVALCDQDDRWYPDKLEVLRAALGEAALVYSDLRLVDRDGRVLRDTLWRGRRNNHTNLASMLIANTITGAAALFRREVAELALPFPDAPGWQFHDHWLALVALASGEVAYVDRPLYDYVQHSGAVFGDVTRDPDGGARPQRAGPLERWRAAYFCGWVAREVQVRTLLVRCWGIEPAKQRVFMRFLATARSPLAFAWLVLRPLRLLAGRSETLGVERELVKGLVWRGLIGLAARLPGRRGNATIPSPASFEQKALRRWRGET